MDRKTYKLGRYTLLRPLGLGGMAEVYLGCVEGLEDFKQYYAVKRILPKLVDDAKFLRMFLDEARVTVALQHPNIVAVHDLGEDHGNYYIAMEYVDGMDLRRMMTLCTEVGTNIPYKHVLFITLEALRALDYAHSATDGDGQPLNLVHRDVSPANVLISRTGAVKLTDFGVSRAAIARWESDAGEILGKYRYFAPELIRGEEPSIRSDLFALGAILYELLTGEPLLMGAQYKDVVRELRQFDPEQALERDLSLPAPLEPVLLCALAREPGDRYASAGEFIADLTDHVYEDGIRVSADALATFFRRLDDAAAPTGAPLGHDGRAEPPSISIVPVDEQSTDAEVVPPPPVGSHTSAPQRSAWRFPRGGRASVFVSGEPLRTADPRELRVGLADGTFGEETLVRFDDDRWRPVSEYRRGGIGPAGDEHWIRLPLDSLALPLLLRRVAAAFPSCVATCWCTDEVVAFHVEDGWLKGVEGSHAPLSAVEILRAEGALSQTQALVVAHIAEGDDERALAALVERKLIPSMRASNLRQRRMAQHIARVARWHTGAILAGPATELKENVRPCPIDDAVAITIREHMDLASLREALEPVAGHRLLQGTVSVDDVEIRLRPHESALLSALSAGSTIEELVERRTHGSEFDTRQAVLLLVQWGLVTVEG